MLSELQAKLSERAQQPPRTIDEKRLARRVEDDALYSHEISRWAATALHLPGGADAAGDLWEAISDGQLLCRLYNNFYPEKSIQFHKQREPFLIRDNLASFVDALRKLGVPDVELFDPADLYERRTKMHVLSSLLALQSMVTKEGRGNRGKRLRKKQRNAEDMEALQQQVAEAVSKVPAASGAAIAAIVQEDEYESDPEDEGTVHDRRPSSSGSGSKGASGDFLAGPPAAAPAAAAKPAKANPKDLMFTNQTGQKLLKVPGSLNGQPFVLGDLTDCEVNLLDRTSQVTIDNCRNCTIVVGPSKNAVFPRDCVDCEFHVIGQQFRTRDCHNCRVFLYSATDPIIESSSGLLFAPYNVKFPQLTRLVQEAGFNPNDNHWDKVHDFSADDPSLAQPHWSVMPQAQQKEVIIEVETLGAPDTPFPSAASVMQGRGGGGGGATAAAAPRDDSFLSFPIGTSQAQAQAALDDWMSGPAPAASAASGSPARGAQTFGGASGGMDDDMFGGSAPAASAAPVVTAVAGSDDEEEEEEEEEDDDDYGPEDTSENAPLVVWQRQLQERLMAQAMASRETREERRRRAKEWLAKFYKEREARIDVKHQQNQMSDNQFFDRVAYLMKEIRPPKPEEANFARTWAEIWERVASLCNLNKQVGEVKSGKSKDRIRSVILQLKNPR